MFLCTNTPSSTTKKGLIRHRVENHHLFLLLPLLQQQQFQTKHIHRSVRILDGRRAFERSLANPTTLKTAFGNKQTAAGLELGLSALVK